MECSCSVGREIGGGVPFSGWMPSLVFSYIMAGHFQKLEWHNNPLAWVSREIKLGVMSCCLEYRTELLPITACQIGVLQLSVSILQWNTQSLILSESSIHHVATLMLVGDIWFGLSHVLRVSQQPPNVNHIAGLKPHMLNIAAPFLMLFLMTQYSFCLSQDSASKSLK